MDVQAYFDQLHLLYMKLIDFIENDDESKDEFKELINYLENIKIKEDPYEFKSFLRLISSITNYHRHSPNFFEKFERILLHYKTNIKNTFSNFSIFNIFNDNKPILLFLFTNDIIILDETIQQFIIEEKVLTFSYSFNTDKKFIEKEDDEEFIKKCQIGENDSYICQLIRDDLVDDFITYTTRKNIPLSSQISPSIFETNQYLIGKTPTLIEYAAFFGSIQIFQYLRFSGVKLTESLWMYAIHSNSGEIIHLLEENRIVPQKLSYGNCMMESIMCHHNDIANYIIDNYMSKIYYYKRDILKISLHYRNYYMIKSFFDMDVFNLILNEEFDYICEYDYIKLVKHYMHEKKINNDWWYPYKGIRSASWSNNSEIVSLIIQDSKKTIDDKHGYDDYNKLRELTIPSSVVTIGRRCFGCADTITTLLIPSSVKHIEEDAFFHCKSLREIILPSSITKIERSTFFYCISLRKVVIPDSVKTIGESAFKYCKSLKRINLPKGLLKIESCLFYNCESLEEIEIPSLVIEIGTHSFKNCKSLKRVIFKNDQSKSIVSTFNNLFSKMIPSFSTIKKSAFKNCSSLEQISIPPIYRKIECRAFYNCNSLNQIDLPSITQIGASAFCNCLALKQISISSPLVSIELAAFENCPSLESVYINDSTNVDIFSGHISLDKIKIVGLSIFP